LRESLIPQSLYSAKYSDHEVGFNCCQPDEPDLKFSYIPWVNSKRASVVEIRLPKLGWKAWLAWAIALTVAAAFVSISSPLSARLLCIGLALSAVVLLVKFRGRQFGKTLLVLWAAFALFPAFEMRTVSEERDFLAALKVTSGPEYLSYIRENVDDSVVRQAMLSLDPDTLESLQKELEAQREASTLAQRQSAEQEELDQLRIESPQDWLAKVEELRPEQHADILEAAPAQIERLEAEARQLPATDLDGNLRIYTLLLSLRPNSENYIERLEYYRQAVEKRDWEAAHCSTGYPEDLAGQEAIHFVKQSLRAPATAKFPFPVRGIYQGDCTFVVSSYVDAENAFGASVRSNYQAHLLRQQGGWGLISLEMN